MWITFKSCIFAFWNNFLCKASRLSWVVNYIQILYLCILKQPVSLCVIPSTCCELHSNLVSLHSETTQKKCVRIADSCELHSNLVSLHSETTELINLFTLIWLWITFKSCIFAFWNNTMMYGWHTLKVVNYIQILYLCILKQHCIVIGIITICCELHSNLVSLHSETT